MVVFYGGRYADDDYCLIDGKFSVGEGGPNESRGVVAEWIDMGNGVIKDEG